jgi:flagellar biosynthetic protein FliR
MTLDIAITPLLSHLQGYLWPLVRIGAFVMVMPLVSGSFVPVRVRLLLALALTAVIVPAIPSTTSPEFLSLAGLMTMAQEIAIGVAIGFSLQLVFDAITLGGQVIAMSMGLGFAVFVDQTRGVNVPVLGQLFLVLAALVFLALDGHLTLIRFVASSFHWLPIAGGGLDAVAIAGILEWSSQLFSVATRLALPAITALIVVNLSFGVMSRAAPTLNLFAVGFPVAMLLGFVVIFLNLATLQEIVSLMLIDAWSMLSRLLGA